MAEQLCSVMHSGFVVVWSMKSRTVSLPPPCSAPPQPVVVSSSIQGLLTPLQTLHACMKPGVHPTGGRLQESCGQVSLCQVRLIVSPKGSRALLKHQNSPSPGSGSGFAQKLLFNNAFWKMSWLESWPEVHTNHSGEER